MSLKANAPTAVAAVAPSAAKAAREPGTVEYPERQWVAQSVWLGDAVLLATNALRHRFRDREDMLVAIELVVYYERGDNTAWLRPDVQVVFADPRTGEDFDGALEEAERRRRIAEDRALAAEDRATAERDRADAADERARALEERLLDLASRTRPPQPDS